ncbi:MAG: WD40 repeat domain-containing protein, partial [Burkholderiales bacterium]|nr:WD40 repeat domain-containing protein [Anaerolineae bacterium]
PASLVKAGLIPALWRGDLPGSEKWFVVEMLPGSRPLDELEVALTKVAANQAGNLHDHLQRDQHGLVRAASLILPNDSSELVLVIDQFEEVFTLLEDEEARVQFLDLLYAAVTAPHSRVRVVVTLRADFYDRPLHYPNFGELVRSRLETIMPLSAEELERAIASPAQRMGVIFEPGLVSGIIADVNYQPGALPLLQYALLELFEERQGRILSRAAYQAIGGTVGALAKRSEEVYSTLSASEQEITRQMFLRLVTLGEGTEDTRRRTARSELLAITSDPDDIDEIIDTFASYRLLSLDTDPGTRTPTVEVAHEALLREWERLRTWLNESRDEIKLQRQLAVAATEWRTEKQDASFLARGSRLAQFESWAKDTQLALTGAEHAFLDASIAQRLQEETAEVERKTREKKLERRSLIFLRGLVAVLVLATLGSLSLATIAANESQNARRSAAEAQNVALSAGSQAALANGNTDQAIALALQAVTLDPTSATSQAALSEAAYAPGTIRTFVGHTDSVDWVAISPDGRTAISAASDNTNILWDLQTGQIIRQFEGHTARNDTVAFMPDGLSAISGSYDTTMIQWDVQTGDIIRRFEGQPDQIWAVAISPDGSYLASGGSGNNMLVWDIQTGEIIRSFEGHESGVEHIEFSADGSKLLSASYDWTIMLWDVETAQVLQRFEGHAGPVFSAVFSPDNHTIASGGDDGKMFLWDIQTGQVIRNYVGDGPTVKDLAFSPDGRFVLSGGVAGLILWDTETGLRVNRLLGHSGFVNSLAFSPDGRTAITASADHTLRLWDLEEGQLIRRFDKQGFWWGPLAASPDGHRGLVVWLTEDGNDILYFDVDTGEEIRRFTTDEIISFSDFSADGQTALLGTYNEDAPSDIILWDVNTGEEIRRFTGHPAQVSNVTFSPDDRMAVSAGWRNTIILWDVATGAEIRRFEGYEGDHPEQADDWQWIYSVAFTPDGQSVFSTHEDGMIIQWDVATGADIRHFEGATDAPSNMVFSSDGRRAFTGSNDSTAILWDVATGSIIYRFTDHSGPIPEVDMTADGRYGIAGSIDNTTLLWDLDTGEVIRRYHVAPYTFYFSPDNRTALVGIFPPSIELWRIDTTLDELLTWVHGNRYVAELTCQQRTLYRLEPLCPEAPPTSSELLPS